MSESEFPDIDRRYAEYNSCLDAEQYRTMLHRKNRLAEIVEEVGEEVLTHPQVRTLAFLMGYKDIIPSFTGPFQIEWRVYKNNIESKLSEDSKVDLSRFGMKFKKPGGNVGYKRSGIRAVFRELSKQGKLDYTDERFFYAIKLV